MWVRRGYGNRARVGKMVRGGGGDGWKTKSEKLRKRECFKLDDNAIGSQGGVRGCN